jgi:hypothetical protein
MAEYRKKKHCCLHREFAEQEKMCRQEFIKTMINSHKHKWTQRIVCWDEAAVSQGFSLLICWQQREACKGFSCQVSVVFIPTCRVTWVPWTFICISVPKLLLWRSIEPTNANEEMSTRGLSRLLKIINSSDIGKRINKAISIQYYLLQSMNKIVYLLLGHDWFPWLQLLFSLVLAFAQLEHSTESW